MLVVPLGSGDHTYIRPRIESTDCCLLTCFHEAEGDDLPGVRIHHTAACAMGSATCVSTE